MTKFGLGLLISFPAFFIISSKILFMEGS